VAPSFPAVTPSPVKSCAISLTSPLNFPVPPVANSLPHRATRRLERREEKKKKGEEEKKGGKERIIFWLFVLIQPSLRFDAMASGREWLLQPAVRPVVRGRGKRKIGRKEKEGGKGCPVYATLLSFLLPHLRSRLHHHRRHVSDDAALRRRKRGSERGGEGEGKRGWRGLLSLYGSLRRLLTRTAIRTPRKRGDGEGGEGGGKKKRGRDSLLSSYLTSLMGLYSTTRSTPIRPSAS